MAAKLWKKIGLFILIIACIFNIMVKLVNKLPIFEELRSSAQFMQDKNNKENKK